MASIQKIRESYDFMVADIKEILDKFSEELSALVSKSTASDQEVDNVRPSLKVTTSTNLRHSQTSNAKEGTKANNRASGNVQTETSAVVIEAPCNEKSTDIDAQKFIEEHWGVERTMYKIFRCAIRGETGITVKRLLRMGPVLESHVQETALQCFDSIHKLHYHKFIKVIADEDGKKIVHIELGPTITEE